MDHEERVLQDRIELGALKRHGRQALERVGRESEKAEEQGLQQPLKAHSARAQAVILRAEAGEAIAEHRQKQTPEQHGAFMPAPAGGDLVGERFVDRGVRRHVGDGEVRPQEARDQQDHRRARRQNGDFRRSLPSLDIGGAAHAARAAPSDEDLHQAREQRQRDQIASKLCNHDGRSVSAGRYPSGPP